MWKYLTLYCLEDFCGWGDTRVSRVLTLRSSASWGRRRARFVVIGGFCVTTGSRGPRSPHISSSAASRGLSTGSRGRRARFVAIVVSIAGSLSSAGRGSCRCFAFARGFCGIG